MMSGPGEAGLPGGRHGGWPAGRRLMTQADRSQWQRSAAGALRHMVCNFSMLPALTWTVSRSGHLSGWAGDAIAAGDRRWAFTAWQEALELPDARESPGTGRSPGRLHARGQWGPVSIGLAASVVPAGQGPPAGAPKAGGFPVTHRQVQAAGALVGLLEQHVEAEAITWRVLPSGFLAGHVKVAGPARDGRALFGSWARALDLDDVTTAPAGRGGIIRADGCTRRGSVDITVTAVMPARSRGADRTAVARRLSQQVDIIHEPPHPGRCRLGGTLLRPYSGPGSPDPGQRPSPRM
jgi:hypothetical protein